MGDVSPNLCQKPICFPYESNMVLSGRTSNSGKRSKPLMFRCECGMTRKNMFQYLRMAINMSVFFFQEKYIVTYKVTIIPDLVPGENTQETSIFCWSDHDLPQDPQQNQRFFLHSHKVNASGLSMVHSCAAARNHRSIQAVQAIPAGTPKCLGHGNSSMAWRPGGTPCRCGRRDGSCGGFFYIRITVGMAMKHGTWKCAWFSSMSQ